MDIMYPVRAHSRQSQVVHLNNLQVYQRRQEESTRETGCWGSVNAPHGEGKDQQSVQTGSSKVESVKSGMVISGAKKKLSTLGGGLAEDVQNGESSRQEITEDEQKAEVKQPICQSQSSVHSSRGHTPFEFMFGREVRIFPRCDDGTEGNKTNYSEFVSDL